MREPLVSYRYVAFGTCSTFGILGNAGYYAKPLHLFLGGTVVTELRDSMNAERKACSLETNPHCSQFFLCWLRRRHIF